MKNILFLILFTSITSVNAQKVGENFKFILPVNNSVNGNIIQYRPGHKVQITKIDSSRIYFRYFFFSNGKEAKVQNLNSKYVYNDFEQDSTISKENIIHALKKETFANSTSRVYSIYKGVRAGFYTIPFKLRLNDFDFEQNINFGMNIGLQYRLAKSIEDRWVLEPNFGVGLSSISLNSKNSNIENDNDRTASAFTVNTGLILHFDRNINLGLFCGWDFLGNNDKEVNWKYNRKTWLGIGINIGFSLSESKDSGQKNHPEKDK